jgi:hypothetical protein
MCCCAGEGAAATSCAAAGSQEQKRRDARSATTSSTGEDPAHAQTSDYFQDSMDDSSGSHFHFAPHGIPKPDDLAMRLALIRYASWPASHAVP